MDRASLCTNAPSVPIVVYLEPAAHRESSPVTGFRPDLAASAGRRRAPSANTRSPFSWMSWAKTEVSRGSFWRQPCARKPSLAESVAAIKLPKPRPRDSLAAFVRTALSVFTRQAPSQSQSCCGPDLMRTAVPLWNASPQCLEADDKRRHLERDRGNYVPGIRICDVCSATQCGVPDS